MNPTELSLPDLTRPPAAEIEAASVDKKVKKEKKKQKKASKGVETMFRTTLANHLRLSEMADSKANLMISINTILISLTLTSFLRPDTRVDALLIPEIMLVSWAECSYKRL